VLIYVKLIWQGISSFPATTKNKCGTCQSGRGKGYKKGANTMNNKNPFFIIANIFLISAIFYASGSMTVEFFGAIGEGNIRISNLILAIVNDSCKPFLPLCIPGLIKKEKYMFVTVLVCIICGCIGMSYLASQGTDLNLNNKVLIETSGKAEIEALKVEVGAKIKKAKEEKLNELAPYKQEIKELPENHYTNRKNILNTMNEIATRHDNTIANLELQLEKYNEKLLNNNTSGNSLATTGYGPLAESLGVKVKTIVLCKNLFLELLAVILSVNLGHLLEVRKEHKNSTSKPKKQGRAGERASYTVKKATETAKKKLRLVE